MSKKEAGLIMKLRVTQVFVVILLIALVSCVSGCIGGKKVNARGAGATITASRLVQQSDGIFRLEPVEVQHPKFSGPVKLHPIKSRPAPVELKSARPTEIEPKVNVIPAGELPKKDPPKIIIPELPTGEAGELPIIIDNSGNQYNLTPAEKPDKIKVNWWDLIKYYLIMAAILTLVYLGYKQYQKKNQEKH